MESVKRLKQECRILSLSEKHDISLSPQSGKQLFTQSDSIKIKAIAVIFMLILHTYTWPTWWLHDQYPYSSLFAKLCSSLNICVAVFAFCSGYAFYYSKNKSICASLLKLTKFYSSCGIVATFGIVFAFTFCNYNPTSADLWNNFLPIKGTADIMKYSWYTVFFGYLMLLLPLLASGERIKNFVLQYLFYILLLITINNLPDFLPYYGFARLYGSIAFFAYFFAKFAIFERVYTFIEGFSPRCKVLCGVIICSFSMILMSYLPGIVFHSLNPFHLAEWVQPCTYCLSVIHTSICIFGLLLIIRIPWPAVINNTLTAIGKHSMNIWLISALLTSKITGPVLQPYIYTKFIPYTLGSIIILCYLISFVLSPLQKGIISILFKK